MDGWGHFTSRKGPSALRLAQPHPPTESPVHEQQYPCAQPVPTPGDLHQNPAGGGQNTKDVYACMCMWVEGGLQQVCCRSCVGPTACAATGSTLAVTDVLGEGYKRECLLEPPGCRASGAAAVGLLLAQGGVWPGPACVCRAALVARGLCEHAAMAVRISKRQVQPGPTGATLVRALPPQQSPRLRTVMLWAGAAGR